MDGLKSRPLQQSAGLHCKGKKQNKIQNSKCGFLYVRAKYKPQIYLWLVSWKPVPLLLVQAGGTIGSEVITQQLLPQKDQHHMLVLSRPPSERDLIKINKTS